MCDRITGNSDVANIDLSYKPKKVTNSYVLHGL